MKIAFVGKGGSGKSTVTSLFIRYLEKEARRSVLAIDADLNMNLGGLLGVDVNQDLLLSRPDVAASIRRHLKGSNSRIRNVDQFLPTTSPAYGSNLIESVNDASLLPFVATISEDPEMNLLTVGSYESDGIGQTCYHSHLFVAENILSHTRSGEQFVIVCDMVAGTDAFAYSMYLQFDAIILIAEPTPESMEVCNLYLSLAGDAGIERLVSVVANKIEDDDDWKYIQSRLGRAPIAALPVMRQLKKARQLGRPILESDLTPPVLKTMEAIEERAKRTRIRPAERMQMMQRLHRKLNEKKWVQLGYGDVSDQIDPSFRMYQEEGVLV